MCKIVTQIASLRSLVVKVCWIYRCFHWKHIKMWFGVVSYDGNLTLTFDSVRIPQTNLVLPGVFTEMERVHDCHWERRQLINATWRKFLCSNLQTAHVVTFLVIAHISRSYLESVKRTHTSRKILALSVATSVAGCAEWRKMGRSWLRTTSCRQSVKLDKIMGLSVIERNITFVCDDSTFILFGGMAGGFFLYDAVFHALIALWEVARSCSVKKPNGDMDTTWPLCDVYQIVGFGKRNWLQRCLWVALRVS